MKLRSIALFVLGAAAQVSAAGIIPTDIMGVGSQFTFKTAIAFDRGRTKWFCDGAERKSLFVWSAGRCCTLHMGVNFARDAKVSLRAGPRTVNYINWRRSMIMIDPDSETYLRCRSRIVTASYVKSAFGDAIEINRVAPPAVTSGRTEF